jgi:hypothetical protein
MINMSGLCFSKLYSEKCGEECTGKDKKMTIRGMNIVATIGYSTFFL